MKSLGDILSIDLRKRKGVYISRPVLNADEWKAWMTRHGVPNPVPDLHVTIIYSETDAKLPLAKNPVVIPQRCMAFTQFGPNDESLVVAFDSWELGDRHWAYREAGATSKWPTFRPHMTLTNDFGAYELPDAALLDVPEYIMLGTEVPADIKTGDTMAADDLNPEGGDVGDGATLVLIVEIAASAAQKMLDDGEVKRPVDRAAMQDIARKRPITKAVAKRLAATDWAPAEVKALAGEPAAKVEKKGDAKSVDVVLTMTDVRKALAGKNVSKMEPDDDRRLVWQIASVTKVNGEFLKDHHGDTFDTRAMEEFAIDLMRGQRLGKIDHGHGPANEIVQALVLSEELQKALGFDLGYEPFITCTYVPDAAHWEEVKKGEWETSISGRFLYHPEEEQAAA